MIAQSLAEAPRVAKSIAEKVEQRPYLGRDVFACRIDGVNPSIIKCLIATTAGLSPLALRVPVGIIFAAHGAPKLFGWFGGDGLQETGKWMASIGIKPGLLMAALTGGAGRVSVYSVLAERLERQSSPIWLSDLSAAPVS